MDAKTGERFSFQLDSPEQGWYWQREVLDEILSSDKSIYLKARQLGLTWLACGLALYTLLYLPGGRVLAASISESEAAKLVNRCWDMFLSLPEHLKNGVKVLKPSHGARPTEKIEVEHEDGRISTLIGLPSTARAGQGETAALVILDEFSRQEYARETWKAVLPTMAGGGRIVTISTANGVSNPATGEGNFFHHLWTHADEYGLAKRFLSWSLHPERDESWYRREAMSLPPRDRAEQYPAEEHEAFILTGDVYFDLDALNWYGKNAICEPLYRARFVRVERDKAKLEKGQGPIRVYEEPNREHKYALALDVATGRGADYSAGYVIDLATMRLCAEFHSKCEADILAYQAHYLGRWYGRKEDGEPGAAKLAVEMGGGYGEPVVIFLRDGNDGRPPYPNLYRHRVLDRGDKPEMKPYGFPINSKSRPLILEGLARALREHSLPSVSAELLQELQTFVFRTSLPSPRAQDGSNDDRVMALAIAVELYRQFGEHPERKRKKARKPLPSYPWLRG